MSSKTGKNFPEKTKRKGELMEEFKILPARLTELRTAAHLTQGSVASAIKIAVPTLANFIKLADFFDVSLDYLVGKKEL